MPPKRRRRFHGLYYHSSPPKVLPMNGQTTIQQGRKRRDADDFAIKLSTIRIWMHEKDIGKLTRILWAGQGSRLCQQASTNARVKRFLGAVPYVMNSIKDVHQAVIDNNLETLQAKLEPPVPPSLITCRDANGLNLIHKAAGLGHTKILEYLIGVWPDGVHELDITGKTPLHWAASAKNNMRCYTLLTQAGCDEEVTDYKMKTPSYYRHKPNEIERAFLTYVPEAPRVSPDVTTDWEALSEDNSDGKKLDIKIPEMNGFHGRAADDSVENTSEVDLNDGVSNIEEEAPTAPPVENGDGTAPTTPEKEEETANELPTNGVDADADANGEADVNADGDAAADLDEEAEGDAEETNTKLLNDPTTTTNGVEENAEKSEENETASGIKDNRDTNGHAEDEENKLSDDQQAYQLTAENSQRPRRSITTEIKGGSEDEIDAGGKETDDMKDAANEVANTENEKAADDAEMSNDIKAANEVSAEKGQQDEQETEKEEQEEKSDERDKQITGDKEQGNEEEIDELNEKEETKGSETNEADTKSDEDVEKAADEGETNKKNEEQLNEDGEEVKKNVDDISDKVTGENQINNGEPEDSDKNNDTDDSDADDLNENVQNGNAVIKTAAEDEENQTANDKTDEDVSHNNNESNNHENVDEHENDSGDGEDRENNNNEHIIKDRNREMSAESNYEVETMDGKLQKFLTQDQETGEQECVKKEDNATNGHGSEDNAEVKEEETTKNKRSAEQSSARSKRAVSATSHDANGNEEYANGLGASEGRKSTGGSTGSEEDETKDPDDHNENDDNNTNDNGDDVDIDNELTPNNVTEEERAAIAAVVEAVAEADSDDKLDENHNEDKYTENDADANGDADGSSPTSSLAIEGFVLGESDDNRVQSQSAAFVDETNIEEIIAAGNMEQLAQIVLNGDGNKLVNMKSNEPEIQAFLTNVPSYMSKIRRVHEAAREGSLLSLQQALDRRKFAIAKDEISPNGATPLHVAVLFGNTDIVRYLAARFPETTTITDNDGRTALHYAATIKDNGHFYNVLTQLGANTKTVDKLGHTPEFYLNSENGAKDLLNYRQLLSAYGAEELEDELLSDQGQVENHSSYQSNPIFKTEQGKYLASNLADPLIKALTEIANQRPEDPIEFLTNYLQNYLRERNPFMSTGSDETGSTAPMNSNKSKRSYNNNATNDFDRIEEDNSANGDDGNDQSALAHLDDRDEHGQSMLHFACARSHRRGALMHLIEESRINITYRDELYRTARDVSLQANQPANAKDIDRYVLSLAVVGDMKQFDQLALDGYDHIVDVADDNSTSVVEIAADRGHDELAEYLRNLRALEELREELHQMIRDGNVGRVKEIVDGENGKWLLKAKNYYGRNALHIALLKENIEVVEHFVNMDPELLKIGDNLERTPLHYAMGTNVIEILSRILIQKGAKRTSKDLKGRQPTYYFMNKADILRLQEEEEENR